MKRIVCLLMLAVMTAGCYDDYIKDFDFSSGFIAYQYDLRTFVPGEIESIDFTVCLGGVINNNRDRKYQVSVLDDLVTGDLSAYSRADTCFTALDGMRGIAPAGICSGGTSSYVNKIFLDLEMDSLTPLPASYYSTGSKDIIINKGRHTGVMQINVSEDMKRDAKAYSPCYALGMRIDKADVDSLLYGRDFSIIALQLENRFYGNWYHGGKSKVGTQETLYPLVIPQADDRVYTLTTVDGNTVMTDKVCNEEGSLILKFDGNRITVSSNDVEIVPDGRSSYFNDAVLLQDRKLYLNYSYRNSMGRTVTVTDSLVFRNRMRDGINEWQDENEDHYTN